MVPLELKNVIDAEMFKSEIRKWKPRTANYANGNYVCHMCTM